MYSIFDMVVVFVLSYSLNLTRREAVNRIYDLLQTEFYDNDVTVGDGSEMLCGRGGVIVEVDKNLFVVIGTKDLEYSLREEGDVLVDDVFFVQTLMSIGHESQHIKQRQSVLRGTASSEIAFDFLADQGSAKFRQYGDFYKHSVREIDCERAGVLFADNYLKENFLCDRDKLISTALNDFANRSGSKYFLDRRDYASVSEVLGDLSDAYGKAGSFVIEPGFDVGDSSVFTYMRSCGDKQVFDDLLDRSMSIAKLNRLMTVVNLKLHPEWNGVWTKSLSGEDLSYRDLVSKKIIPSDLSDGIESDFECDCL